MKKAIGRKKHIRRRAVIFSGALAVSLAGVIGFMSLTADAGGIFTGVETLVYDKVDKGQDFHILEIIPDQSEGELGYYVEGQEPFHFAEDMNAYLKSDGRENTRETRAAFVEALKADLESKSLLGENKAIRYEDYEESYFPSEEEKAAMQEITFDESDYELASISGNYQDSADGNGAYTANIDTFTYNEDGDYVVEFDTFTPIHDYAPYNVPFEYNSAGYYQQVENPVTGMKYYYISNYYYGGVSSADSAYTAVLNTDMPYRYVGENGEAEFAEDASGSATKQNVQIGRIYYKGGFINQNILKNKVFSIQKAQDMNITIETVEESALADYDFSGGNGNVDMIYVCGDTTRNGKTYGNSADEVEWPLYQIYCNKIPTVIDSDVLADLSKYEQSGVLRFILLCLQKTKIEAPEDGTYDFASLLPGSSANVYDMCNTADITHSDFAVSNLYVADTADADNAHEYLCADLETNFSDEQIESGFSAVREAIDKENLYHSSDDQLAADINRATVLQYLLNYRYERQISAKKSLKILDLEPVWGAAYANDAVDKDLKDSVLYSDVVKGWAEGITDVSITHMTTSEFIGKINDMNTDYDLVYIGLGYFANQNKYDMLYRETNSASADYGLPVYNDTHMNGMVYTHTGDYMQAANYGNEGLLDSEYAGAYIEGAAARNSNYLYGTVTLEQQDGDNVRKTSYHQGGYRNSFDTSKNRMVQSLVNIFDTMPENMPYYRVHRFNGTAQKDYKRSDNLMIGNSNVFRYSGNDITKDKYQDLLDFVKAKYPVVFADDCYIIDDNGKKSVNEARIDNSSYLYQFLTETLHEPNVFSKSEVTNNSQFIDYLNMPKLGLEFYQNGTVVTDDNSITKIDTTDSETTGQYRMKIDFMLKNQAESSMESTYNVKFYIDMNTDGQFSDGTEASELLSDILVLDRETGTECQKDENGVYKISNDHEYELQREISSSYRGLIPWKLEIENTANNYIRTSKTSYAVVALGQGDTSTDQTKEVHVLQIMCDTTSGGYANNLDLSSDASNTDENGKKFNELLRNVENETGLHFIIDSLRVNEFQKYYRGDSDRAALSEKSRGYMDRFENNEYSMLILGFSDCYNNMTDEAAIQKLQDFKDSGKSILFTHDNASCSTVTDYSHKMAELKNIKEEGKITADYTGGRNLGEYGYDFNQMLRREAAMDRYGLVTNDFLKQGQLIDITKNENGETIGTILAENGGFTTRTNADGTPMQSAVLDAGKDIAYVAGTNREQAYGETQGFTYSEINRVNHATSKKNIRTAQESWGNLTTTVATKTNEGLITKYPYVIPDKINIASTHFQYYQLDLDGDKDGDGRSDIVVWYCLGDAGSGTASLKNYSGSPNDVRNNYYIYSMGNVMYSGVGHSKINANSDEMKLFVNTVVASFKLGTQAPTVKALETSDRASAEKKYVRLDYDTALNMEALSQEEETYFTVQDLNLTSNDRKIQASFYIKGTDNKTYLPIGAAAADNPAGSYVTIEPVLAGDSVTIGSETYEQGAAERQKADNLQSGHVYRLVLHNIGTDAQIASLLSGTKEFSLGITISSEFNYYGRQIKTSEAETEVEFIKAELFDLD